MSSYCGQLVRGKLQRAINASVRLLRRPGLFALLIFVLVFSTSLGSQSPLVRLYWDANTEVDLAGYVLAWGSASGTYTEFATLGKEVSYEAPCPSGATRFFAIRAFNTAKIQSGYSNEVRVVCGTTTSVKLLPRPLGNVVVVVVRRG